MPRREALDELLRELGDERRLTPRLRELIAELRGDDGAREGASGPAEGAARRRDVRADAALREKANQFRTLAENVAAATFIYQGERFRYVNEAALRLTGYTRAQLRAMRFWELVHPDHRELVRERGLARQQGATVPPQYEFRILTASGESRWVDFTARTIRYRGEPAVLGTAFDVTDVKTARAALEQQALTFENLYDAVVITDLDGLVTAWNPAAERMLGWTRAEAIGRSAALWVVEGEEHVARQIERTVGAGDRWEGRVMFARKDGSLGMGETVAIPLVDARGVRIGALSVTRDITERVRAEDQLTESERRYRDLFLTSRDAIFMTTVAGRFDDVNPAFLDLLGYTREEIMRLDVLEIYRVASERERLREVVERNGEVREHEVQLVRSDGRVLDCLVSAVPRRDPGGATIGFQGIVHDITERKRVEEQLAHGALHDALTGIPNRALFLDRLAQSVERHRRAAEGCFAVLFMDLDRFKVINDSMGHAVGDDLLRAVAARITAIVRAGDTVARFGGDEFTVLLESLAEPREAMQIAERILQGLGEPFLLDRQEVVTTASIGLVLGAPEFADPAELLRNADAALGRAKAAGKSRIEVFDGEMHARALERLRVELDLRRAVERGELALHYQPIVSLADGRVQGLEALLRWHHPERGLVAAAEFIPVAEETGLIVALGGWAIEEVARQAGRWREAGVRPPGIVAVNVSPRQFARPELPGQLERTAGALAAIGSRLAVEVTESVVVENPEAVSVLFTQLRHHGVELHLDDFGTGYSSLGYLHRLPIDVLKIDRSFITRMTTDERSAQLVQAIASMAHNLGMRVIAEGLGEEPQRAALHALGCDLAQGYLIGRPVAAADLEGLVAAG